jgi:hypothetical protein
MVKISIGAGLVEIVLTIISIGAGLVDIVLTIICIGAGLVDIVLTIICIGAGLVDIVLTIISIGAGLVDIVLTIIVNLFNIKILWTFMCANEAVPEQFYHLYAYSSVGRNDAVGIVTTLRARRSVDQIPVGATFPEHVQSSSVAHPTFCTMAAGSLSRG